MNLKVYILPPLNLIFSQPMLKIVAYQMLIVTNVPVNSAALWQFMQCVTLLLIDGCENTTVSISGAEINLTLRAVTTYDLCCNLAPSMSALKVCIFSNIVMK